MGTTKSLIIGELFWEQTGKWQPLAERHVDRVFQVCRSFFNILLMEKCPEAIRDRLSALHVPDALRARCNRANNEVQSLMDDNNDFPTSYDHYYTDAIQKQQLARTQETMREAIEDATSQTKNDGCQSMHMSTHIDLDAVVTQVQSEWNRDMLSYSCEHVLDCLLAMYKDKMKTFIQRW
jgi:hypothetical protein